MRKKLAVVLAAVLTLQSFAIPAVADEALDEGIVVEEELVGAEEIDSEDEDIVDEVVGEEEIVEDVVEDGDVEGVEEIVEDNFEEVVGDQEVIGEDNWDVVGAEEELSEDEELVGVDDSVTCTVTLDGGLVVTKDSLSDAVGAVSAENGSIAVEGTINNDWTLSVQKSFKIDLTKATFGNGASLKKGDNCYLKDNGDGTYDYHGKHTYTSKATANEKVTTYEVSCTADVTLFCAEGEGKLYSDKVGEYVNDVNDVYTYALPVFETKAQADASNLTADEYVLLADNESISASLLTTIKGNKCLTWTVKKGTTSVYARLGDFHYIMDGTNLAALDSDGNPQIYIEYTLDDVTVLDDKGVNARIYGTILYKDTTKTVAPRIGVNGSTVYHVSFEFPDKTMLTDQPVTVQDVAALKAGADALAGFEILFKDKAGVEKWMAYGQVVDTTKEPISWKYCSTEDGMPVAGDTEELKAYRLAFDENGTVTFRGTYVDQENKPVEKKEYLTISVDKNNTSIKACGAGTYAYKGQTVSFTGVSGKKTSQTLNLPTVTITGTHKYDNWSKWASTFEEVVTAGHNYEGYAIATCACGQPKKDDKTNLDSNWVNTADIEARVEERKGTDDKIYYVITLNGHDSVAHYSDKSKAEEALQNLQKNNYLYKIPKTQNHAYASDSVETIDPTCEHMGFSYKKCVADDGGWVKDGNTWTYTFSYKPEKGDSLKVTTTTDPSVEGKEWHPVLVESSLTPIVDHALYISPGTATFTVYSYNNTTKKYDTPVADQTWTTNDDVVCHVIASCAVCKKEFGYYYHKITAKEAGLEEKDLDDGSTDTKTTAGEVIPGTDPQRTTTSTITKYGKTTATLTDGKDCTEASTVLFAVDGLSDAANKQIAKKITSAVYSGAHDYESAVTFSENGKSANVVLKCKKIGKDPACKGLKDASGREATTSTAATVTPTQNTDGSTTYTATLEGIELTNNTKSVYDLTQATVTVNGGKPVDMNKYETIDNLVADKLIEVKINNAAIDSNFWYEHQAAELKAQKIVVGNNSMKIVGQDNSGRGKPNTVDTKTVVFEAVEPSGFGVESIAVDGIEKAESTYKRDFDYDGTTHTVVIKAQDSKTKASVENTTVKYAVLYVDDSGSTAVLRYYDTDARVALLANGNIDPDKFVYNLDSVNLTNAETYYVYAQFTAEGYTTYANPHGWEERIIINPSNEFDKVVIAPSAQTITYGDTNFKFTTGDDEIDEKLDLDTKLDVSELSVGEYVIATLFDYNHNYELDAEPETNKPAKNVTWAAGDKLTIVPRNAKIVLADKTWEYTGVEVDPQTLYTVDGVLEGDNLGVVVNTEGNRKLVEPGTYKLIATANNANYTVAEVTATVTITAKTSDQAAAQSAIDAINALTATSREKDVKDARAAYEALTPEQKAIVSPETLAKLATAEAAIASQTPEQKSAIAKADTALSNPTDKNIEAAQAAIDAAKKAGADTTVAEEALAKARTANAKTAVATALQLANAAKSNPTAANIAAADKAIAAANAKTQYMDAATKSSMTQATNALAAARKASSSTKITFGNAKVKKALNKKGTKTSRIKIKQGKKFRLKAKSSNGTKITYKAGNTKVKVSNKGVVTAVKAGKTYVLVTSGGKKVKVLFKIAKAKKKK